ncbi:MAG: alpha/beta fold hydrolase [Xanthomonadales bacterium]|nr:alpha/beta fold hydrolase [Xanthomonadales bacterium]
MSEARPEVVLVHGLWYRGWSMLPLGRRLEAAGFRVRRFSYPTLAQAPAKSARSLAEFCDRGGQGQLHLVGHSLGGLLIMHMLAAGEYRLRGRIVLLGAPLAGSRVARRITGVRPGRWLLGQSADVLAHGVPGISGLPDCGMIAGTRNAGLGRLSGARIEAGDGTVALAETVHPAVTERIELPVSHTSMLLSAEVARQVVRFLSTGRFGPA